MIDAKRFFAGSAALGFGSGIISRVYFQYLEHQARQGLPPELRTPEAIESIYDGAVCLSCETTGTVLSLLFFSIGFLALISWGIFTAFPNKQLTLK